MKGPMSIWSVKSGEPIGDTGFVVSGFKKKSLISGSKNGSKISIEASELFVSHVADGRQVMCMIGVRHIPLHLSRKKDSLVQDQQEARNDNNVTGTTILSFNKVLPSMCSHSFGEKYTSARMTKDMWQEGGTVAVKPILTSYRKFRRLELGYAIDGKRLCQMVFFAPLNGSESTEKIERELHDTRQDLEARFHVEMKESTLLGMGIFKCEDDRYRIELWLQTGAVPGICLRLIDKLLHPSEQSLPIGNKVGNFGLR